MVGGRDSPLPVAAGAGASRTADIVSSCRFHHIEAARYVIRLILCMGIQTHNKAASGVADSDIHREGSCLVRIIDQPSGKPVPDHPLNRLASPVCRNSVDYEDFD